MFLKYAKCCSNMRNVAQIEQHFVYLSVNNNTHIKKTLHKVLQSIFCGGAKFILVSVTRIWRAFRWCQHFSTKHLPQSLDQTSTSKNLPMFNLKVFNENILQNHDQTLVLKPWQYLALKAMTKIKVLILYQTSASKSWPNCRQHSINISNTNNLNSGDSLVKILKLRFGREFEPWFWSRLWGRDIVKVLKLKFDHDFEVYFR